MHTDTELECSVVGRTNAFFQIGHSCDRAPGLSLKIISMFSEERGMFAVRDVMVKLSGAYLIASNAFQARGLEYILTWKGVLDVDTDAGRKHAEIASAAQEADAAADMVREAMAQRLEKLSQPGSSVNRLTLEPTGQDTTELSERAVLDVQVDRVQVVIPSMRLGEGAKLNVASLRLTQPGGINPHTQLDLYDVQLDLIRSSSGAFITDCSCAPIDLTVSF